MGNWAGALLDTETAPQLSLAVGVPRTTPVAKHTPGFALTVTSAGQVMVGGWVSRTVTVKMHWPMLPLLSVAVLVTVVTPTGKAEPLAGTLTRLVTLPQGSLARTTKVTFLVH